MDIGSSIPRRKRIGRKPVGLGLHIARPLFRLLQKLVRVVAIEGS